MKPNTVFKLSDLIVFIGSHYRQLKTSGGDLVASVELHVNQEQSNNVDEKRGFNPASWHLENKLSFHIFNGFYGQNPRQGYNCPNIILSRYPKLKLVRNK